LFKLVGRVESAKSGEGQYGRYANLKVNVKGGRGRDIGWWVGAYEDMAGTVADTIKAGDTVDLRGELYRGKNREGAYETKMKITKVEMVWDAPELDPDAVAEAYGQADSDEIPF
jgi:hypothetical protein